MIETLLKFLNLEKIDKQLVKKIPYHLCLFTGLSLIGIYIDFSLELNLVQLVFFISLFCFLIFNTVFNHLINSYVKNYMDYAEFDKFTSKLSGILDGNFSIFSEGFDKKRVYSLFLFIVTSGLSLLIFELSIFALLFYYFQISIEIQLLVLGLLLFYIYSDVMKLDFIDKDDATKGKYSFEVNMLERFTVTNPIESMPYKKYLRLPLFFAIRMISPIASLDVDIPYIRMHFVYRNPELNQLLEDYTKKKDGVYFEQFTEKENKSYPLDTILTNEKPASITNLSNHTLRQNFPFLLDSKYFSKIDEKEKQKPDAEMKYTVLKIIRNDITVGYLFIRLFHGAFLKTSYSREYPKDSQREKRLYKGKVFHKKVERKEIYCIIMIGHKDYVKGIETKIKTYSQEVQQSAFGIELEDEN